MSIGELQPKQGFETIEAEVTDKGEAREFQKFGEPGRVCTAKIKDATGECNLSLWNEQIDQVNVGDKIKISNGYTSEWQGDLQVTTGKNGTLKIVGKSEATPEDKPAVEDNVSEPVKDSVEEEEIEEE